MTTVILQDTRARRAHLELTEPRATLEPRELLERRASLEGPAATASTASTVREQLTACPGRRAPRATRAKMAEPERKARLASRGRRDLWGRTVKRASRAWRVCQETTELRDSGVSGEDGGPQFTCVDICVSRTPRTGWEGWRGRSCGTAGQGR